MFKYSNDNSNNIAKKKLNTLAKDRKTNSS